MLLDFGDSSVVWEVSIWAVDPWSAPASRSDLNKAIWWGLKDAGVTVNNSCPTYALAPKEIDTVMERDVER